MTFGLLGRAVASVGVSPAGVRDHRRRGIERLEDHLAGHPFLIAPWRFDEL